MPNTVENASAEQEAKFLNYTGNAIPWGVRLVWIFFWILTIYYVITFMIPAIQTELLAPP